MRVPPGQPRQCRAVDHLRCAAHSRQLPL